MMRFTLIGSMVLGLGLSLVPLTASAASIKNLDAVMLNPQPLPPKEKSVFVSRGDTVMLNPQPLPSKLKQSIRGH